MIVRSDQLNCYIEGIKIPIFEFRSNYGRNKLGYASIIVPTGGTIVPKMWANAFVQVTYVGEVNGTRKEKLLFQGLCVNLNVAEEHGKIQINAISCWDSLNLNTTLDYVSPKKYGLKNIQDGIAIWIGTEATAYPEIQTGYKLSERFFYVDQEEDIKNMAYNDPESYKLQFIADRAPFAERYAYNLFEDLSYGNFLLSRSFIDRFNLLAKSSRSEDEETKYVSENVIGVITLDFEETDLFKQWSTGKHEIEPVTTPTDSAINYNLKDSGSLVVHGLAGIISKYGEASKNNPNIITVIAKCGPNGKEAKIQLHKLVADNFVKMFEDLYNAGLSHLITEQAYGFCYRPKNTASGPSSQLSVHSWGIAFDINQHSNPLKGKPTEAQKKLADFFAKYGWIWGNKFNDPMHFQLVEGY